MIIKQKKVILNIIGIFFIIFGILAFIETAIINNAPGRVLWFCYVYLFITGISILRKDSRLLVSQLNILLLALVFWNIDFYFYHLTGNSIIGLNHYYILPGNFISKVVTLQHLFSWILALFALYLIKQDKKKKDAWKLSFIQITLLFVLSFIFSSEADNVNCVLKTCFNFDLPFYHLTWFIIFFLIIYCTNLVINKIKIFNK